MTFLLKLCLMDTENVITNYIYKMESCFKQSFLYFTAPSKVRLQLQNYI